MTEAAGRHEASAGQHAGVLLPRAPRDLGVVAVVEDEHGDPDPRAEACRVQPGKALADTRLQPAPCLGPDRVGQAERGGIPAPDPLRVRRRGDDDRPLEREASRQREERRGAAHRVRDGAARLRHPHDRGDGAAERGKRRRPPAGRAVAGRVEDDGPVAGGDERRHERPHLRAAAAPSVDEDDRRAASPRPRRELPALERNRERVAGREERRRLAAGTRDARDAQEQPRRRLRREAGRRAREERERSAEERRRTKGSIVRAISGGRHGGCPFSLIHGCVSSSLRPAGDLDEGLERARRALLGARVAEKSERVMVAEHDRVEVVSELLHVEVLAELALGDRTADRRRDEVQEIPLLPDEAVARGSGPVVQLDGRRDEHAAAGQPALLRPLAPVPEERAQARLPAGRPERGLDDDLDEARGRILENGDLEALLRAEVREKAAFRELELVRELPDRQPFETRRARERGGAVQDRLTCVLAFAHGSNLERSFVPVKGGRGISAPTARDSTARCGERGRPLRPIFAA